MIRKYSFIFHLILLLSICSSCYDKEIKKVDLRIYDYSKGAITYENLKELLSLIECDSVLLIPRIILSGPSFKDTFNLCVDYEDFTSSILPLDYEATVEMYNIEDIKIKVKSKDISEEIFIKFLSNTNSSGDTFSVALTDKSIICSMNDSISLNGNNDSNIIYTKFDELKGILNSYLCDFSKPKSINIYLVSDKSLSQDDSISIHIDNVLSNKSNNNSITKVDLNKFIQTIDDELKVNTNNWFLYYLKARLQCLIKQVDYRELAVDNLASAARLAIDNLKSKDSLLNCITNLKSLEFKQLFEEEELFKARLDGTLAALRSNEKNLIDVPLYFLTYTSFEGYTKKVPIVYFEKKETKPYVSKGLEKEIAITISNQDNNGTVTFDLIDKSTRSTIDNVTLGKGKQREFNLKGTSNPLYITNLTHTDKPFIALAIETGKKKGEGEISSTKELGNSSIGNQGNKQNRNGTSNPSRPVDTDSDGIADSRDHCPKRNGPASNNGCPVVSLVGNREFYIGNLNSISVTYNDFHSTDIISWSGNDPLNFSSKNGREIEISSDIVGKFRVTYDINNNNDHFNVTNSVVFHAKISDERLESELMNLANYGNNRLLNISELTTKKQSSERLLDQCFNGNISINKSTSSGGTFSTTYYKFKDELLSVKRSPDTHVRVINVTEISYDENSGKIKSFRFSLN